MTPELPAQQIVVYLAVLGITLFGVFVYAVLQL
jgi:hypothetical protein